VQQDDHGARGFADDLVDQVKRVLRAFSEADKRDVGSFARGDSADVSNLDLPCDHLVAEGDDDGSDERKTILALVCDEYSQMLGLWRIRARPHSLILKPQGAQFPSQNQRRGCPPAQIP
jgi:hypothetical protein